VFHLKVYPHQFIISLRFTSCLLYSFQSFFIKISPTFKFLGIILYDITIKLQKFLDNLFVMYYEDYELEDIYEFNKKMLQYMLWYNTERLHHSLNKKSPLQYFCDIINSRKSEFSQTGMTYKSVKEDLNEK